MKTVIYYCLALLLCIVVCNNAEAKIKKYPNGDVYEGEMRKGKPHGEGKMIYVSGDIYEGTWVNGFYKQGKKSYVDGNIYEGEWLDGYYKKGKMSYANGDIYEGEWQLGKPEGKGKMSYSNGNTCEGNWYKGELSYGKMIYANGDIYEGAFSIGIPNGIGKMTYANGGFCEGEWKMNQFYSGKINIHYENGDLYEGMCKRGKIEGEGIMTYANGKTEKLKYKNGKILNKKITIHPDNDNISEFTGINYEDETMDGSIKYKNYKTLYDYNGKMVGNYERHGQGILHFNDNNKISTIEGLWQHDSLVSGSGKFIIQRDTLEVTKKANQPIRIFDKVFNDNMVVHDSNYSNMDELYKYIKKQKEGMRKITVKKPGTILSYLDIEELSSIKHLTITGFLYETDLAVINQCTALSYLDLSHTFITDSPQAKQEKENEAKALLGFVKLLGVAADLTYGDGNLSNSDYIMMKALAKLGEYAENSEPVKQANENCFIPKAAFKNMQFLKTVKLPLSAIEIKEDAFYECENLENIQLPPYLKSINEQAFAYCKSLKNIEFPSTLSMLKQSAFRGCDSIERIDLSKNTFSEFKPSFNGTTLKEMRLYKNVYSSYEYYTNCVVYFPSSLEYIGGKVYNCELHFSSSIPPKIQYLRPDDIIKGNKIYIPKGSLTGYFTTFGKQNTYIEE
ncbi:leucine-rich repeat protein [uncultured Odoribacter sp.]|uniref:leucine-rich repeat protein n=1 Tax=uncultured Odoribacter sp. TaxID=876416 RepID=UPI002634646B|nr:leucine-rich repeat protein [uncultured Odoribacter sp.]